MCAWRVQGIAEGKGRGKTSKGSVFEAEIWEREKGTVESGKKGNALTSCQRDTEFQPPAPRSPLLAHKSMASVFPPLF